jgi:hypothetical protein
VRNRNVGDGQRAVTGWDQPAEEADQSYTADHTMPFEVHQPGCCGMASGTRLVAGEGLGRVGECECE